MAIVAVLVLVCGYAVAIHFEQGARVQARGVDQQKPGTYRRIEYNGQSYAEKTGVATYLLIGVDQTGDAVGYGARQGGQADFLMLVVIDHGDRQIRQLQIDRDTIAQVETLGVLGNPVGTKSMQICLSHAFGRSAAENCESTVHAVQSLLEGVEINGYLSMNLDAIGKLNDALGGFMVTLDEDLSAADSQMTKGATLRLNAEQAELLVRRRMDIGDGTNEARMKRQRLFMSAALDALRERIGEDVNFVGPLFDALGNDMVTNVHRNQLLDEANRAYNYEILPVESIDGEYCIGEDGFVEFHMREVEAARWAVETFYEIMDRGAWEETDNLKGEGT